MNHLTERIALPDAAVSPQKLMQMTSVEHPTALTSASRKDEIAVPTNAPKRKVNGILQTTNCQLINTSLGLRTVNVL